MLVFMFFSMLAYFMYKALIGFYTGALKEIPFTKVRLLTPLSVSGLSKAS